MGREQAVQFRERSSGPFGIPNSLAALLDLLLPPVLALVLQRRAGAAQRILAGYVAAVLAVGLLLTVSRGAWLSLGLALAAWPLFTGRNSRRRWLASLGVCLLLAAIVAMVYERAPEARQRLDQLAKDRGEVSRVILWRMGWALFRDRPVVGTGAGSYDVLLERHRPLMFGDNPQWAHNEYLNTLSDYGVTGFLLAFGVLAGFGGWTLCRLRGEAPAAMPGQWPAFRTGIVIGLVAFALQLFVDFNLKIPALGQAAAALLALVLAPAADGSGGGGRFFPVPRFAGVIAVVMVGVLLPWRVLPLYRAEALRYSAREILDQIIDHPPGAEAAMQMLPRARGELARAVQLDPENAQAWADLADAMIQQARATPEDAVALAGEAGTAASRALAISHAVPEFWLRRGMAYDLQGRWRDAWADFTAALTLAPHRADLWYYYAYHLSLRDLESARAALATSLRLDPWNGPALAFQKHLSGKNH